MRKVAFFVKTIGVGGVSKSLQSIVNSLNKDLYEVHLFQLYEGIDPTTYFNDAEKIFFHTMTNTRTFNIKTSLKTSLRSMNLREVFSLFLLFLKGKTKKHNYQLLKYDYLAKKIPLDSDPYDFAIDYIGYASFITYFVSNRVKASKKATWIHTEFSKSNLDISPLKDCYKNYDNIIAVSNSAKNDFEKLIPSLKNKVSCIKIPLLENDILFKANEMDASEMDDDRCNLLTVGRLNYEKGYDIAIDVARKLKDKGYGFTWFVIGEGNEREKLEDKINKYNLNKYFVLLGNKENPYPYFKKCNIYIQPSRYEGFCITLSEAKLFNKPIITTNFQAAYEQIENNKNGIIVKIDTDEIYNAITHLMDNPLKCIDLTNNLLGAKRIDFGSSIGQIESLLNS